ncbi:hypothetical protein QQF64_016569, partial [Cirrhinus molitorella]
CECSQWKAFAISCMGIDVIPTFPLMTEFLSLYETSLTTVPQDAFANMANISRIYLSVDVSLSKLEKHSFYNLKKLTHILTNLLCGRSSRTFQLHGVLAIRTLKLTDEPREAAGNSKSLRRASSIAPLLSNARRTTKPVPVSNSRRGVSQKMSFQTDRRPIRSRTVSTLKRAHHGTPDKATQSE